MIINKYIKKYYWNKKLIQTNRKFNRILEIVAE